MTEYVAARRAEGIHAFQLKIGGDPYEDIARTTSVVESTGAGDTVVCDANGGWGLQDAVVVARGHRRRSSASSSSSRAGRSRSA